MKNNEEIYVLNEGNDIGENDATAYRHYADGHKAFVETVNQYVNEWGYRLSDMTFDPEYDDAVYFDDDNSSFIRLDKAQLY